MAVTEQSLAALEQRVGERLKGLDGETGALAERLHGLRQRLEKFEQRQTAALAQLRLDVHNISHRDDDGSIRPLTIPAAPEPVAYEADIEPVLATDEMELAGDPAAEIGQGRLADYLNSARQSAIVAAERQATKPIKHKSIWRKFLGSKRRWAVLAALAALVAWFDIYVFAHYQPAQGAVARVDIPAVPVKPVIKAHPEWSPRAQLVRGLKYLNGTGIPVDVAKARMWIERAALGGQPVAENLMGVLSQTGTGAPVNMAVAVGWYEGAAKHGNLKAMTNLGKIYAGGWPEGTDFTKASEWFAHAAAAGEVDAAFDLAILYERGQGVTRNLAQAYKWYAIAGARGDSHAATRAATLASELTPEEREAADAAVASFQSVPVDAAANEVPQVAG
jgi:TPR repeat protein